MTARVGDVVEWTTRARVSWCSSDGRQVIIRLPVGQSADASPNGQELALDLDQLVVVVCAPDVQAGDVWRTADGLLWHALSSFDGGEPMVWLYPSRLTATDRPMPPGELHEQRQLVELVLRDEEPGGNHDAGLVGEADTAVFPRVGGEEEVPGG